MPLDVATRPPMTTGNSLNRPWSLAPINTLPPELLTRIFYLVLRDSHTCLTTLAPYRDIHVAYPNHPQNDILTHVCSYWRSAALDSPKLWTHIDIAVDHPLSASLVERAKAYAARASPFPIDIHVTDTDTDTEPDHSNPSTFDFLDTRTVPIRSFNFDIVVRKYQFKPHRIAPIEYFLARCQPGTFTEYCVRLRSTLTLDFGMFLLPEDTDGEHDNYRGQTIRLSADYLEQLWFPTHTLHVSGLCPPWSSRAYHGLVDLRITDGAPAIEATQLLGILRASPELRVLHLRTFVLDDVKIAERTTLKHLERLYVSVEGWGSATAKHLKSGRVLDLLSPGSNPLQFGCFRFRKSNMELLQSFITRSNITFLFVESFAMFQLPDAIHSVGRLETLVVYGSRFPDRDVASLLNNNLIGTDKSVSETTKPQIEAMYLAGFDNIYFEALLKAIERYSVQKVVICGGGLIYKEGSETVAIPGSDKESIGAKLSAISSCHSVEYSRDNTLLPIDLDDWRLYHVTQ